MLQGSVLAEPTFIGLEGKGQRKSIRRSQEPSPRALEACTRDGPFVLQGTEVTVLTSLQSSASGIPHIPL